MEIKVSEPSVPEAKTLRKDDVWGIYDDKVGERVKNGMVVARSEEKCPIFKDTVPYKSATLVCALEQEDDVEYWSDFVMGCESVSMRKELKDGRVALRCDYQCW